MYLSKSQYLRGLQCHKALWLYRHRHDLMAPIDAHREALFASGHQVGELAKERFPGGIEIEFERGNFDVMAARTAAAIEAGETVIYEATFISDGWLAMADILLRNGDRWDFFEVKSSTRVKPYHFDDAVIHPARPDDRVVAVRKLIDELRGMRLSRRLPDLGLGRNAAHRSVECRRPAAQQGPLHLPGYAELVGFCTGVDCPRR